MTHRQNCETEFEALMARNDLYIIAFPRLSVFHQTNPHDRATRMDILQDPQYREIQDLTVTVLSHIVQAKSYSMCLWNIICRIADEYDNAADAFKMKFDSDGIQYADVEIFLRQNTPTIVFKTLEGQEDIMWGLVVKETEEDVTAEGAEDNELYLSSELLQALCSASPVGMQPERVQEQAARQRLIFSITLCREVANCATKYFFGHKNPTPKLIQFESDSAGRGEAGATLERDYFGFNLEVLWLVPDGKRDDRLWLIDYAAARFDSKTCILDGQTMNRIQQSFRKPRIWMFGKDDLAILPSSINDDSHLRYRGSVVVDDSGDEDDGRTTPEGYIRSSLLCGRRCFAK
ncbi:hypothetical protein DFH06DRAFT_1334682 [Mycena polygramma]|nr:hypothetical protein DFH06DRAFT_1334682 [Mycena polygramma]